MFNIRAFIQVVAKKEIERVHVTQRVTDMQVNTIELYLADGTVVRIEPHPGNYINPAYLKVKVNGELV